MASPDSPHYPRSFDPPRTYSATTHDSVTCDHPLDGIHWNPRNRVTQCHRCGHVFDETPMPSDDAMHWTSDV